MIRSENISVKGCQIIEAITKVATKYELDINEVDFYSSQDWEDRGEPYCNNSLVVMTFDGGWMYDVANFTSMAWDDISVEINEALRELGVYYECGHSWNAGVYHI